MKMDAKTARVKIWEELLKVARPDSKFSWEFSEFIADYEGSDKGAALLASTDMYKNAKVIFITPDNNLEKLRETAFRDKKTVVMTTVFLSRNAVSRSFSRLLSGVMKITFAFLYISVDASSAAPLSLPS